MMNLKRLLSVIWAALIVGFLWTIANETIRQRQIEQRTQEFQRLFPDQGKLKKQLEQIEAIQ